MYSVHGECFDCVILKETRMRAEGSYDAYVKDIMNGNKNAMLYDLEQALDDWMTQDSSFVSEDGVVEDWSGGKRDTALYDQVKEAIKKGRETEI